MHISTLPFKISAGEYLSIMFKMFIAKWWWAFLLVVSSVFAMAIFNIAFIFVGLMLIFIIIPMIMSFLYIYYGLLPETRLSILEKSIEINDHEITFHFEHKTERILLSRFTPYHPQKNHLILPFKSPQYTFLAIPYTAFRTPQDLRTLCTHL